MRVLVIGGAGYIGSHAVRKLIEEGNDVVVLDSLYTGHRKAVDKKAKFYQGDIEDTNLVSKILRDENIDAVMHFAAYSLVPESIIYCLSPNGTGAGRSQLFGHDRRKRRSDADRILFRIRTGKARH